jgi:hypothetical protein
MRLSSRILRPDLNAPAQKELIRNLKREPV